MFKISQKAQKLFEEIHDEGLLTEANFKLNHTINRRWEKLSAKFYGTEFLDCSERAWEAFEAISGHGDATAFSNGDNQIFIYFMTEKQLLSNMKHWRHQLHQLWAKAIVDAL